MLENVIKLGYNSLLTVT